MDLLPEAVIHHIQSFLTPNEAAQTATLCKSWRTACLTHPHLELNAYGPGFQTISPIIFKEYAMETMRRYQDTNLSIRSFTLCGRHLIRDAVVIALNLGATHLNLSFCQWNTLPKEVLQSETLVHLSVRRCRIKSEEVKWRMLNSLTLRQVTGVKQNNAMFSSCCLMLRKLELSYCDSSIFTNLTALNPYRFEKLEFLLLENTHILPEFFGYDFAYRFPLLKDLCVHNCPIYNIDPMRSPGSPLIQISSHGMERVSLSGETTEARVEFDTPSMRKFEFTVAGSKLVDSHVCMGTLFEQLEARVTIRIHRYGGGSGRRFFQRLGSLLMELRARRSKIWLCITAEADFPHDFEEHQVIPRAAVDSLTVDVPSCRRDDIFKGLNEVCTALQINEPPRPRI